MKRTGIYAGATLLLLTLFYLSLTTGIIHIHSSLWSLLSDHNSVDGMTVWQIRLPRALGALVIGAALGIAGALAQTIFRNPLAEPTLIGLSSGATLGSIAVISSGAAAYGSRTNVEAAIGVALCAALLVQWLAPNRGFGFLLTGIAISSIFTALAGVLISISPKPGVQSLAFWNFGSLTLLNNHTLQLVAPFIEVGIITAFFVSRRLDAYSLGESSAIYLGVNPKRLRLFAIFAMAFLVGGSVSAVGSIAFLGLLVPHIVRLLVGPTHRQLFSLSALIGATLLLFADFLARSLFQPHEIPLGLVTSLLGAPILIALIRSSAAQWVAND